MKRIGSLIALFLLVFLGIFLFTKKTSHPSSFVKMPIHYFPIIDLPRVNLQIGEKQCSFMIDLGSSHQISLKKELLEKLKIKNSQGAVSSSIGIRGIKYPIKNFPLPELNLSPLKINGVIGSEENPDFHRDAILRPDERLLPQLQDKIISFFVDGRIGWPLFKNVFSVFDHPGSMIYLAKNKEHFVREANYSLNDFTELPLKIEKCGLVVDGETDSGSCRFLLDTGSSLSILKRSDTTEEFSTSKIFKIGDRDFGSREFFHFEFSNFFDFDGILGLDFFNEHVICLDLPNEKIYIK